MLWHVTRPNAKMFFISFFPSQFPKLFFFWISQATLLVAGLQQFAPVEVIIVQSEKLFFSCNNEYWIQVV